MKGITLIISLICLTWSSAINHHLTPNDFPAYLIYTSKGKEIKFSKMLKDVYEADIVFVGELHDNPISHWMELQLTKAMQENKGKKLVLGAEMFESDNQLIMDEYLEGKISEQNFRNEMRLWKNYETDYKPLVEFAKSNKLRFIATNIPRRYASIVYKKGLKSLDSLSETAKSFIAPLPIEYDSEVVCYKNMLEMMGGHGGEKLPMAQAIKDATMAHFILENWKKGQAFLHFNGAYHSDDHEGIVWWLKKANPELKIVTITTVLQEDVNSLNEAHQDKADYVLCVNSDMTSTH